MLKEYLVVKLRDFLAVMIEAKEEEERGEALAPGKPRRSAAERAVKK